VACLAGCDVLLNLSASPFHAGKGRLRRELVARQARRAGAPMVYVNQVGGQDELVFDGGSLVMDAEGRLLAELPVFEPAGTALYLGGAPCVPSAPLAREEEVHAAIVLGLRDFARRCGFRTAVLGLSGGIDSAVVACLAVEALGAENVVGVGMPGPFSSPGSVTDAEALARNLGIRWELLPIAPVLAGWEQALAPIFSGTGAGVAEENLQARARGTLLMALSNKFGHLVLTTGNKSEIAVGYCTLYGDMNGGIAPIADLYKTEVQALARWINRDREIIPQATLDKAPSAELRPEQKDEDSLPPYPVLDRILRMHLEESLGAAAIIARGEDPVRVREVLRLVRGAEFKRWQAAPGLRVSTRAFGTGRRMPLARVEPCP
jgi:NAD+ synthase (glutamine-hydrolysing)